MPVALHLETESAIAPHKIGAAKIHVLGLTPLKTLLGPKWAHLSELVHKLFEKAIAQAQGPNDHFVELDELSYAVTFSNLSLEQTNLVCASIARQVCEHLFGSKIGEVSVRSIVAATTLPAGTEPAKLGALIERQLEQGGTETVVTQSVESGSNVPVAVVTPSRLTLQMPSIERIKKCHERFASYGLRIGFQPVWELRKGGANSLMLVALSGRSGDQVICPRAALNGTSNNEIVEAEIDLLDAACAYAKRVHDADKVCAIGTTISYESLCVFKSRIRYITALQKCKFSSSTPLLLKIEKVPEGAPDGRLAELIAMLSMGNIKLLVEFEKLQHLADNRSRLGASGFGGTLPAGITCTETAIVAERLVALAVSQKAFAFLNQIETASQSNIAYRANVRFGTGASFSPTILTGLEATPPFPLTLAECST